VCVGCVVILKHAAVRNTFPQVRDSKKLSEEQRAAWFSKIEALRRDGALVYSLSFVSARVIDARGISHAIFRAVSRTLSRAGVPQSIRVLLDGGLRAPKEFHNQKTIIRGDEKELAIALASIVAKVRRDAYMVRVAREYPAYGFDQHKGYGTRRHINAIRRSGFSPLHRRTFCRKLT
jgi:ribonuclease HII